MDVFLAAVVTGLAAIAIFSAIQRSTHRAACAQLGTELVAQGEAIRRYAAEHDGTAPEAGEPGLPAGMAPYTSAAKWTEPTALGGHFRWLRPAENAVRGQSRLLGSIAITAFAPSPPLRLTRADLLAIDQQIDDGDLTTGRFRIGFNGWPVYRITAGP